ncbi:hypothetical protein DER45DRAFT_533808 [Fusarium avenaceum]|nr:hypothetical protein DER45DRAFT_533808 [Fusarium avenaceum]
MTYPPARQLLGCIQRRDIVPIDRKVSVNRPSGKPAGINQKLLEHGTAILSDSTYDLSAIGNLDAVSNPSWHPWYLKGEPSYGRLFAASGGDPQHEFNEIEMSGLIPHLTSDFLTTEWTESLKTQDSLPPQSSTCDSFSSISEYELYSKPIEPKTKKPRLSRKNGGSVSPSGGYLVWNHQQQKIPVDTHVRGTTNEAATLTSETTAYTRKVRERNRRAANKVRYKQREAEKSLESMEKDMGKTHRDLTAHVQELNNEIQRLKLQLLQHTGCDCVLIQEYIACEASRYIQDISKDRSANH